tara:strand:- start:876 stop:1085 length:210 start_codon:yes stop_codon:yes gene_type:complete
MISLSSANEIDCNKYEKLSIKYLECNTKKLKKKVGNDLKTSKKNFEESELTKKLKKFKNSKTLSDLGKN